MLEYDDFVTLGTYLHQIAQRTYSRMVVFIEQVKRLR
jgi:hypothetical protein